MEARVFSRQLTGDENSAQFDPSKSEFSVMSCAMNIRGNRLQNAMDSITFKVYCRSAAVCVVRTDSIICCCVEAFSGKSSSSVKQFKE